MSFAGASAGSRWHVYATKSLFVITENIPSPEAKKEVTFLGISRESGVTREGSDTYDGFQQKLKQLNGAAGRPKPQACSAVLGCLTAHQESFLLLAAEVTLAADADGQRIFEIARCEALPFSPAADASSEAAAAVAGVTQLLGKGFYFSWDLDITRRLQQRLATPGALPGDLMQAADDRYAWNQHLVEPLTVQPGVSGRWFSPIIQGFIQMREFHGQSGGGRGAPLLLLLIARRSRKRAGTRYNARGLDDEGETGNWVETEQLVKIRRSAATTGAPSGWISLVQVRGSAPVFWEQNSAMQGISVTRGPQLGHLALEKHHRWVEAEYGHVFYVSLLSKTAAKRETEGVLSDALSGQLQMVSGLQWQHVDFNASVTGDEHRFDAQLDKLAQRLSEYANSCGYLDATQDAPGVEKQPPRRHQAGVIRTNCFDCLDRTNLLQQQLAWQWLTAYLAARPTLKPLLAVRAPQRAAAASSSGPPAALGGAAGGGGGGGGAGFGDLLNAFGDVLSEMTDAPAAMSARPALQGLVREMWAALGDALSLQYTGAASTMGGALRRGGHTALAVLEKGWRSVNRAYCAHFEDGARQSAMDLMLGKHKLPRAPGAMEARRAPCGQLTVAAVTWNCHGRAFWDTPGHVETLIRGAVGPPGPPARPPDVMVFCFQEMLALTAANVVTQAAGDAAQQERFEAAAVRALAVALGEPFVKVQGIGMVGLYVGAFVAKRLGTSIAGVAAGRKASGLYGQAGNKGAVGVRFEVAKTAVCALSVHLESGQNKAGERAAQLQEILLGATPFARPAMPVTKHDLVILAGDFNFRLALPPGADASSLRKSLAGGWPGTGAAGGAGCVGEGIAGAAANPTLLRPFATYDELAGDRGGGGEVQETIREAGLMEGPVLFPATYRLYEGSGEYDPERIPAWCDRVLHSKVGVVRRRYCALGGLLSSDHRPVGALLETSLLAVPGTTLPSPAPAQPPAASTGPADLLSGGTATTSGGASASASQPAETANAGHPPSAQQLPADLLGDGLLGAPAAGGGAAAATATTTAPPAGASGYPHQQKQPQQQRQPQQQQQQQQQRQQQQQQQQRSPTAASLLDASFDDALPPAAAPSPAPAPAPAAAAAAAAAELPGRPLPAAGVAVGQFVLAEHAGGWFFANVTRVGSGTCDVAWRRPSAATWGRDQSNERYLCSTGADETMHGDKIPVATRIRLPDAPGGGAAAAAAGGRAPETAAPAPAAGALPPPPPPDLLGEDPPAAAVDLLG